MADQTSGEGSLARIRSQARQECVRVTVHAHQEMAEENVTMDEVLEAAASASIIEDYPDHRRGRCCLLHGVTRNGRHLHIVCTTSLETLVIITVYEPPAAEMAGAHSQE
jgi:hypothetical protein